ncbi:hypothetical protein HanRHA438_Chr01g0001871 [Helianthus annuus]|uniref:Uncharacterized protein n=1 Tax=Helianthus annuus TaxID=4232 RepID=A0A9K3JSG3_HELAN|nr:hypothetical protein HanXRQr2_Chr01g0001671 [Helianthus annuus]KAJ0946244.1 hypothetical protein HanRHA438_Chr01g0001871 [Helianthus annuus]
MPQIHITYQSSRSCFHPCRPGLYLGSPRADMRSRVEQPLRLCSKQILQNRKVVKIRQCEAITTQILAFGQPRFVHVEHLLQLLLVLFHSSVVGCQTEHGFVC